MNDSDSGWKFDLSCGELGLLFDYNLLLTYFKWPWINSHFFPRHLY